MPHENFGTKRAVKTAVCTAAFLLSAAAFFSQCRGLAHNYFLLFSHDSGSWILRAVISFTLLAVALGVLTLLVRPLWLLVTAFFLAAMLYPLVTGGSGVIWITAGIFFVLLIVYGFGVSRQLKNQIKFSTHPLADRKLFLASLFALLVAVSFWQGFTNDASKRAYIFPPEMKTAMVDGLMGILEQAGEKEPGSPAQKKQALDQVRQKFEKSMNDAEKQLEPSKEAIPVFAAVFVFLTFQFIFWVLTLAVLPLLALVMFTLKKTRFAHETVEKREVTYLTLQSK